MDEAIRAAQRDAETRRDDPAARVAYAEVLLRAGCRAAAWHEVLAATRLGGDMPRGIAQAFEIEKPAGTRWRFARPAAVRRDAVARPVDDARSPGASVRCGDRDLPLVLVLGGACDACPVPGTPTGVCTECGGRGVVPDSIENYAYDPWGMAPCPSCSSSEPPCALCHGFGFRVTSSGGPCGHAAARKEFEAPGLELSRCEVCGLAVIDFAASPRMRFACGQCGLFDCGCLAAREDEMA